MKKILLLFILMTFCALYSKAQNDTTATVDLLGELNQDQDTSQLLPERYIFTQRVLWGKKGLMRNFNTFELSPEERERELKIRRIMLTSHQVVGFATMAGMVAQGFVGAKLYSDIQNGRPDNIRGTHEALAGAVNIGYYTTAALSLFAPPKMINERKGYSSIKVHKALAIIHFTGMLATNILASQLESHPDLKPYHRAAAFTAFGAFAASMIILKF